MTHIHICFWQAFPCYIPHTCTFLLKGYLLTNIHILKGIFTLPIQHIHILKGIFCCIFTHFARHFQAISSTYIHNIERYFLLYIHTLCKAFSCYIYILLKGIFCYIFTHFARNFNAIYSTYIYILLKDIFHAT